MVQLDYLVREDGNIEPDCPSRDKRIVATLRKNGITTYRLNSRGYEESESAKVTSVNRSGYPDLMEEGRAKLAQGDAAWALEDTPNVLAALADEFGDRQLAARILDLGSIVTCPACGQKFELSTGIKAL